MMRPVALGLYAATTAAVLFPATLYGQEAPTQPGTEQTEVSKPDDKPQPPSCLPQRVVGIAETANHYYAYCSEGVSSPSRATDHGPADVPRLGSFHRQ